VHALAHHSSCAACYIQTTDLRQNFFLLGFLPKLAALACYIISYYSYRKVFTDHESSAPEVAIDTAAVSTSLHCGCMVSVSSCVYRVDILLQSPSSEQLSNSKLNAGP